MSTLRSCIAHTCYQVLIQHDLKPYTGKEMVSCHYMTVTLYLLLCFLTCVHSVTVMNDDSIRYNMTFIVSMYAMLHTYTILRAAPLTTDQHYGYIVHVVLVKPPLLGTDLGNFVSGCYQ